MSDNLMEKPKNINSQLEERLMRTFGVQLGDWLWVHLGWKFKGQLRDKLGDQLLRQLRLELGDQFKRELWAHLKGRI